MCNLFTQATGDRDMDNERHGRVADWLSHSQATVETDIEDEIMELQQQAQCIIEDKKTTRFPQNNRKVTLCSSANLILEVGSDVGNKPLHTSGVTHLKKLVFVKEDFGTRTQEIEDMQ